MKIEDIQEQLNNLGGSEESRKAIGKLIDMKTDENMDKLLGAIDKLDHKLDVSVGSLRSEMNASIGSLKGENRITYWVVGIAFLAITCLLTIIAFKK